jgi:hypothetical protein
LLGILGNERWERKREETARGKGEVPSAARTQRSTNSFISKYACEKKDPTAQGPNGAELGALCILAP